MDVYWSVDRCGWVPCQGRHELRATPWSPHDDEPDEAPVVDLPLQATASPAPVEA